MLAESGTRAAEGETVMGVSELGRRRTGLQVVAAWWLLPLLEKGVGMPLEKRCKVAEKEKKDGC